MPDPKTPDTTRRPRLVVLNPNTNAATTRAMVSVARVAAPGVEFVGVTAAFGAALITTPAELHVASQAVQAAAGALAAERMDGAVVAAFGDPGLGALRDALPVPVTGLAEAGLLAAARIGRFAVVTTTPALAGSIAELAARYGCADRFAGVRVTDGDAATTMRDPTQLVAALERASLHAVREDRVDAIVIGGGPLAAAARELASRLPVPAIEPLPSAVARILSLMRERTGA